MKSLQRHLTIQLLAAVLGIAAVTGTFLYFFARARLVSEFDRALTAKARMVSAMVAREADGKLEFDASPADLLEFEHRHLAPRFELWTPEGNVFARSGSQAERDLPRQTVPSDGLAIHDVRLPGGESWRLAILEFTPHLDADDGPPDNGAGPKLTLALAQPRRELDHALRTLLTSLLVCAAALAGGTIIAATLAVRGALTPLRRLGRQADEISAASLDMRFSEHVPYELKPIARALNDLLNRLDDAFQRERRFTADAAHELRTPIAELRSLAEVAMRWPDPALSEQHFRDTQSIALRMEAIVTALLAIARHGACKTQYGAVQVAELLKTAWKSHEGTAAARRLCVEWDVDDTLCVYSDKVLLLPVFENICSNAVAHTPPAGKIIGRVSRRGDSIILSLRNTCRGLTKQDLPHVFEPFWRKDPARAGDHCGLGLSLVAAYAAAIDAQVSIELADEETFVLTLVMPAAAIQQVPWTRCDAIAVGAGVS